MYFSISTKMNWPKILEGTAASAFFSKSKLLIVVLFPYRNFGIGARNPGITWDSQHKAGT